MNKLFIIGNGFDLAHGLKTSYTDFRHYLNKEYPENKRYSTGRIEGIEGRHGEIEFFDDEFVGHLIKNIDNLEIENSRFEEEIRWCDLENDLGNIDFFESFSDAYYPRDEDGDIDKWKETSVNEEFSFGIPEMARRLKKYFQEWISTMDYTKIKEQKDFYELIKEGNNSFLNFNYTETLEKIYKVEEVCHIHGKLRDNDLFFGHGDKKDYTEELMNSWVGAEDSIQLAKKIWKKDTDLALSKNKLFFKSLENKKITAIYSYGFSFSDVDLVYIKEILKYVDKDVIWYLNSYKNIEKQKEKLRKNGVTGKIVPFICKN